MNRLCDILGDVIAFVDDVRAMPRFWRALRAAWLHENPEARVAEAAASVMMSALERVEIAEARLEIMS